MATHALPTVRAHALKLSPTFILSAVVLTLLVLGAAGGIFARSAIEERDAALAAAQAHLDEVSAANIAFQDEVASVAAVRDLLSTDLGARTGERDALNRRLESETRRAAELDSALTQAKNQSRQAAEDSANQHQRADNADARSAAVRIVLGLDEQKIGRAHV